jgi:hypothetical protein
MAIDPSERGTDAPRAPREPQPASVEYLDDLGRVSPDDVEE